MWSIIWFPDNTSFMFKAFFEFLIQVFWVSDSSLSLVYRGHEYENSLSQKQQQVESEHKAK